MREIATDKAVHSRNANGIESGPYAAKSADFAWQLFWAGASIIVRLYFVPSGYWHSHNIHLQALSIPIGNTVFFRPLLHCLNYLSCALSPPGAQSSIFGVITVPVKYMPYVMLAIELLTGGPAGVAQCIPGALIGHLWWWGVWGSQLGGQGGILQQWARAPTWLEGYLGDRPVVAGAGPGAGRGANQGGGVHVIPPRRPATSAPPGSSSSGYNWGSGQALGNS